MFGIQKVIGFSRYLHPDLSEMEGKKRLSNKPSWAVFLYKNGLRDVGINAKSFVLFQDARPVKYGHPWRLRIMGLVKQPLFACDWHETRNGDTCFGQLLLAGYSPVTDSVMFR